MTTLADLVTVRRWIAWCNERRGGKLTKVPYCAVGRQAESNNPEHGWRMMRPCPLAKPS
jgi:hypothetical protein